MHLNTSLNRRPAYLSQVPPGGPAAARMEKIPGKVLAMSKGKSRDDWQSNLTCFSPHLGHASVVTLSPTANSDLMVDDLGGETN